MSQEQFLSYYPQARAHQILNPNGNSVWAIYRHIDQGRASEFKETEAHAWEQAWEYLSRYLPLPHDLDVLQDTVSIALTPIAHKYKKRALYWIGGDGDAGFNYCQKCGNKEVRRLQKIDPRGDYFLDGGWVQEEDTPAHCNTCNHPLTCNFTTHACEYELDHFEQNGFDIRNPGDCDSYLEMVLALGSYNDEPADTPEHRLHILTRQIAIHLRKVS